MDVQVTAKELKRKPEEVFEQVWRTMVPRLYRFALSYVMNSEEAEDIVRNTFMTLWSTFGNLSDGTMIDAWLYASVKNACLNYYKHLKVEDAHREKLTESLIYAGTLEYEDDSELLEQLRQCLQRLPEQQRRVLELKVFKGMSYKEIAEELGLTEFTVQTHVKRAYKFIRETMPECLGLLLPYFWLKIF